MYSEANHSFAIIFMKMKKRGFTLIELLVVITIIGLLSSVGLASFTRAQARARDAKRQSDMTTLRNALELYYSENNFYVKIGGGGRMMPGVGWYDVSTSLAVLVPDYTKQLPADPGGKLGKVYRYSPSSDGQSYCLEAFLETIADTQTTCTVSLQSDYNYGVGNP